MLEIIKDTLIDGVRLLPFLFITYLIMEYLEHKTEKKTKNIIQKSGKLGPLWGATLGVFPQCGFSAAASNLYAGRVITLGTLIAIFLSTSDEMLPVLISKNAPIGLILKILAIKLVIGIMAGFVIDFITHTLNIFLFIIIITFILNIIIHFFGEENLSNLILNMPIIGPIIAGLVGLIPNCAGSVILTQLYLENVISIGSMIGGLLVGSGIGILILFRVNKNIKENLKILGVLYAIGVICGVIIDLIL